MPGNFFKAKDTQKMLTITDYDHSNIRRLNGIQHAFEAWTGDANEPTTHIIDVAAFLEYCAETNQIHADADISRHGSGLVRIPERITSGWDAGRGEFYEQEKTFSYSFVDFLADFSGAGLTEALTKFLNDSRICAG